MSRITTPTAESVSGATAEIYAQIKKAAGTVPNAGGFPAMTGNVAFLMKDVVLLAVSIYLLKQDILRLSVPVRQPVAVSQS